MEAKDLMIGDIVLLKADDCYQPLEIGSIEFSEVWCSLYNFERNEFESVYDGFGYDMVEPIPLTPEILAKNGFDVKSMIARIWSDYLVEYEFHTHTISIKNGINTLYLKVQYVHKLQHALRECELTELADNFKVK